MLFSMVLASGLAVSGCRTEERQDVTVQPADTIPTATPAPGTGMGAGTVGQEVEVELIGREGQRLGTARLSEAGQQGVQIALRLTDFPAGPEERGIHFHQTGQCDAPSFQSAGPHFAPTGRQHGLENPEGPHAGDMPNLNVGQGGTVNATVTAPNVTLREGEPNSVIGTALIIHAQRDDQRTDPSGDSGDRIACGVVRRG